MLLAVFKAIVFSVFTFKGAKASATRSGVFLISFLIVHVLGNFVIFGGKESFNQYSYMLNKNPLLKIIEYYLLTAAVVHSVAGAVQTFRKGSLGFNKTGRTDFSLTRAKLALTGGVLAVYVFFHVYSFKWGECNKTKLSDGTEVRDVYTLQIKFFADKLQVLWYVLAVGCLGIHLWGGWNLAVWGLDIPPQHRKNITKLGQICAVAVSTGFAVCPMYSYYLSRYTYH